METKEIDIFKCLDFLRDNAEKYAIAKAHMIYMTEYRKTIKAEVMNQSMAKTESAKETEAYASQKYKDHLKGLEQAITDFEHIRWLMLGAEVKAEVWRSLESSNRAMDRSAR